MKKREKAEKIGASASRPVTGGYIIGGGVRAVPHNLILDIRRNKLIYILLVIVLAFFAVFNMMLILRMGAVFSVGADKILLLYSPANYEYSDVINTYVYRMGMTQADYGLSTAVGLFNSIIGTILLMTTNAITKKLTDTAMF